MSSFFPRPCPHPNRFQLLLVWIAGTISISFSQESRGLEGISLTDPKLQVELIDTHPDEFFLSHDMDLQGRLFLGSREGVFVYERTAKGGFEPRRELYRFPKDTWVYDLETFGDDLLVLTNTALYRLDDVLSAKPKLKKILWGNPLGHHHQGLHGIEFAPDGTLLLVMGDPHPNVNLDKERPDHLWHWTWYVGPENRAVPYSGVGAVMRLDLDNYDLSVYATGLRNACGISFDRDWHLFANDNDQEGSTANPCRLVYVPPHSWNGWARGWDTLRNTRSNFSMTGNMGTIAVGFRQRKLAGLRSNCRKSLQSTASFSPATAVAASLAEFPSPSTFSSPSMENNGSQ